MRASIGPERRRRRRSVIGAESAEDRQEAHGGPPPDLERLREGIAEAVKSPAISGAIQAAIDAARAGGRQLTDGQVELLERLIASPEDEALAVGAVYGLLDHERPFSQKTAGAIVAIFRAITTFAPELAAECIRLRFPNAAVEIAHKK